MPFRNNMPSHTVIPYNRNSINCAFSHFVLLCCSKQSWLFDFVETLRLRYSVSHINNKSRLCRETQHGEWHSIATSMTTFTQPTLRRLSVPA